MNAGLKSRNIKKAADLFAMGRRVKKPIKTEPKEQLMLRELNKLARG